MENCNQRPGIFRLLKHSQCQAPSMLGMWRWRMNHSFVALTAASCNCSLSFLRWIRARLGDAQWGYAFTKHGVIGKIFFVKKYFITPSVFKLQKWFLHQSGVEFNQKSKSKLTKFRLRAGHWQEALGCSQSRYHR